ncbi:transposase [bacterium]|nr:transposase [bacterium]
MSIIRTHNRLPNYDYSESNYYFITTCTENKTEWFGEIINDELKLNKYGEICLEHLQKLPYHFDCLEMDIFVIMPNHIHAIFIINNLMREGHRPSPTYDNDPKKDNYSLADIMRGFKTFSANQINKTIKFENKFKWQRSFYDHIIRNDKELDKIRQYIQSNPAKWLEDKENPNVN